jgi:hypothetical protein
MTARHPNTRHLLNTLAPNPNLEGTALEVARAAHEYACTMAGLLQDGPELSAGLRKTREAKDCFVIQALADSGQWPLPLRCAHGDMDGLPR